MHDIPPQIRRYDDGTFSYDYYIKIAITLVPNPYRAMSSVLSSTAVRRLAAVSKKVRAYTFCDEGHLMVMVGDWFINVSC